MRGKRNAGWYGLALLLGVGLVGGCGGMETDDARLEGGQAGPGFFHAPLPADKLVDLEGPGYDQSLVPGVRDPKRDPSLKRPARRPLPQPEPGLVRCGDDDLVDPRFDPDHCGGCFHACATQFCYYGACTVEPFGR